MADYYKPSRRLSLIGRLQADNERLEREKQALQLELSGRSVEPRAGVDPADGGDGDSGAGEELEELDDDDAAGEELDDGAGEELDDAPGKPPKVKPKKRSHHRR